MTSQSMTCSHVSTGNVGSVGCVIDSDIDNSVWLGCIGGGVLRGL